ncbi:hypothetical protein DFH07DRAFT_1011510 [Mycena maculata]|uniref:Uncharacterized protein n=1 Tax=Mycena maculata TaxID=230809 RepID=A0AAD7MIC8_9AGAR|nr:hypothetical protein DFH07DRAFT_1011510 [Mycena maculata]
MSGRQGSECQMGPSDQNLIANPSLSKQTSKPEKEPGVKSSIADAEWDLSAWWTTELLDALVLYEVLNHLNPAMMILRPRQRSRCMHPPAHPTANEPVALLFYSLGKSHLKTPNTRVPSDSNPNPDLPPLQHRICLIQDRIELHRFNLDSARMWAPHQYSPINISHTARKAMEIRRKCSSLRELSFVPPQPSRGHPTWQSLNEPMLESRNRKGIMGFFYASHFPRSVPSGRLGSRMHNGVLMDWCSALLGHRQNLFGRQV